MRALVILLLLAAGGWWFFQGRTTTERPPTTPTPARESDVEEARKPQHGDSYLSDAERTKLFDLERADLLLARALAPLKKALMEGDEAVFRAQLAAGFEAHLPQLPPEGVLQHAGEPYGFATLQHAEVEGRQALDAEQAWAWFQQVREAFARLDTVKFARKRNGVGILDGFDTVAESAGVFRFAGAAKGGGLLELAGTFTLRHAGLGTYDGEAPLSSWAHRLTLHETRVVSAARALFEEITPRSGVVVDVLHDRWEYPDEAGHNFYGGTYLGDVDGDGNLDLYLTERGQRSWLYLGTGEGTFIDSGWNPPHRHDATIYGAIFDATGDGVQELLHDGMLYTWDEAKRMPVAMPRARRLPNEDTVVADFDGDGKLDLYFLWAGKGAGRVSKAYFDYDRVTGRENLLYKNVGGGRFADVTYTAGVSGRFGSTFGAQWIHANDDLLPDLFCANEFGRNTFLVSRGDGTYEDRPEIDPEFGGFSMGVCAGDFNEDGRQDLYVSNMYSKAGHRVYHHLDLAIYPKTVRQMFSASIKGNRLYLANGDLTFEERGEEAGVSAVGWGYSGGAADFDLDGRLDVYAPCGHISVDRDKPDG